jgi:hypothetical protein
MPRFLGRFRKGGGGVAAGWVQQWLTELKALPPEERAAWWEEAGVGYLEGWLEMTAQAAPSPYEAAAGGMVAQREYRWYRLRRKEHERILARLQDQEPDALGPQDADCVRALVSHAAAIIGSRSHQTWANEWRFYSEGLERFGLKPHFPVPPSFSGKFPEGMEDL